MSSFVGGLIEWMYVFCVVVFLSSCVNSMPDLSWVLGYQSTIAMGRCWGIAFCFCWDAGTELTYFQNLQRILETNCSLIDLNDMWMSKIINLASIWLVKIVEIAIYLIININGLDLNLALYKIPVLHKYILTQCLNSLMLIILYKFDCLARFSIYVSLGILLVSHTTKSTWRAKLTHF